MLAMCYLLLVVEREGRYCFRLATSHPLLVFCGTYLLQLVFGVESSCSNADQVADLHSVLAHPYAKKSVS